MWKQIVSELLDSGLSQKELSELIGCSQPYICDLASGKAGKRLGFELGKRLTDLHQERCGDRAAA